MCHGTGECKEANESLTGWSDGGEVRRVVHWRLITIHGSSSSRVAMVGGYSSGRKPAPVSISSSPDRTARAIGTAAVVASVASTATIADIECYRV